MDNVNRMLSVFQTGLDGDATYSLKSADGNSIYSKMKLADLAKKIVDKYPELAEKIANFYKVTFVDDFSDEFDISRIDGSKRDDFIKKVSELVDENNRSDVSKSVKEGATKRS
jgi:hypothetical protein